MNASKLVISLCAVGMLGVLTGCPDTEGRFNDFQERSKTTWDTGSTTSSQGGGCVVPAAGEVDGDYLFALSASLSAKQPVLFDAKLTTSDGAGGLQFNLVLHPLDAKDRTTKVGESADVGTYDVADDGSFVADLPLLQVAGAANPISGSDLEAEAVLAGVFCAGGFICGDVTGQVTKPTMLDLAGSTFTIEQLASPGQYPEPPHINCAMDEAKALKK